MFFSCSSPTQVSTLHLGSRLFRFLSAPQTSLIFNDTDSHFAPLLGLVWCISHELAVVVGFWQEYHRCGAIFIISHQGYIWKVSTWLITVDVDPERLVEVVFATPLWSYSCPLFPYCTLCRSHYSQNPFKEWGVMIHLLEADIQNTWNFSVREFVSPPLVTSSFIHSFISVWTHGYLYFVL